MKNLLIILIAFMSISLLIVSGNAETSTPVNKHEISPARLDLVIPDELYTEALESIGYKGKPLGYTIEEMANYRGSEYVLNSVANLFRDIKAVPRVGGRLGDMILKDPNDIAIAAYMGYSFLDVNAGRGIEIPTGDKWGVDWIPDGTSADNALELVIAHGKNESEGNVSMTPQELEQWNKLPVEVKRLSLRIAIASIESIPFINQAFDQDFIKTSFKARSIENVDRDKLYNFAVAPWGESDRLTDRGSFDLLSKVDLKYIGFASQMFLILVQGEIKEYNESLKTEVADFKGLEINTPIGLMGIFGKENDRIEKEYSILIDLGGNDAYIGEIASPSSFKYPLSVVLDLSGNDDYNSGDKKASLACGDFGIGMIFDLAGDDKYTSAESGIGCGLYGTGIVVDYNGNDIYTSTGAWGQAAAHAGLGMLIDMNGNDSYYCIMDSQGFGSTLGVGMLVDATGNDTYLADPKGNPSEPFQNRTVSFAQGTGYGRRADFGDGHSLGGGVGILIEGGGNDSYAGGVYCQGAGYWWSLGILEDRGGDDIYKNDWYSLGSAPHFAIGSCVDLSGNDKYNIGNEDGLVSQTQGCGRDGSIAVFIDGSGDDQYFHRNRCAGSGDLNSIALFWDRAGNDSYKCNRDSAYVTDLSYGDAPWYEPFGNFHDEMPAVGLFFDTGGLDKYDEIKPATIPDGFKALETMNNSKWQHKNDARFRSYGLDIEWY